MEELYIQVMGSTGEIDIFRRALVPIEDRNLKVIEFQALGEMKMFRV